MRAASPPVDDHVKLKVDDGYALGSHDAPVTLVEFTDYQCPYCRAFHKKAFVELKKSYIDTGKLRFISRDLPMEMHADAPMAAEAARCAGDQGKYWEIRESLFSNPASLNRETVLKYAGDLALNVETFRDCLDHEKYKAQIERDASDAASIGIDGTPTFVLGKSSGDTVEGIRLVGARPYASFEADIKKVLAEAP